MWTTIWFIIVTHGLVLFMADSASLNAEAMVIGHMINWLMKLRGGGIDFDNERKKLAGHGGGLEKGFKRLTYFGLFATIVGRAVVITAGCVLFGDDTLQCGGTANMNYTDTALGTGGGWNTANPWVTPGVSWDSVAWMNGTISTATIVQVCRTDRMLQIYYWVNFMLNAWYSMITANVPITKLGGWLFATANLFTATAFFVTAIVANNFEYYDNHRVGAYLVLR